MEPLEDEQLAGQVLTLTAAATPRTEFREIKANAIRVKELDSMWGVDISTVLGPDVSFSKPKLLLSNSAQVLDFPEI